jgi:hypothetical protein
MTRNRVGLKQICFDIPIEVHKEWKKRAADQYISLKDWLIVAAIEKIKVEKELGWK